jgi:hypothetical protein
MAAPEAVLLKMRWSSAKPAEKRMVSLSEAIKAAL